MKEEKILEAKKRKYNMRLYQIYVSIGSDYLFYYGVRTLYLAQVKLVPDAEIVFLSTIFALVSLASLIFANMINNKINNRRTLIIGDIINIIAIFIFIIGKGTIQMAISSMLSAIAYSLKNISTAPILEESIPKTANRSEIFSRIDGKAYFRYCTFAAISTVAGGILYDINPYIPVSMCLVFTILSLLISINFKEIDSCNSKKDLTKVLKEIKDGFTYTVKSKRIRALLLSLGFIWGMLALYTIYQSTLLKNMNFSAFNIGIIIMCLDIAKGIGGRFANEYNRKFKNRSLTILSLTVASMFVIVGINSTMDIAFIIQTIIIFLSFMTVDFIRGIYTILYKKYDNNFSNVKILPTVYTMTNIYFNVERIIITSIGAFVLTLVDVKQGFIIMGLILFVVAILISIYMKTRIGLKIEEYSKEDLKYASKD